MTRLRHHLRRDEQLLLGVCTTRTAHTAPAVRPLPGISAQVLHDLRADDSAPGPDHHRYDADRLLPRHAAVRRVVPARVVLDDIDTVTADILAAAPVVLAAGTGLSADLLGLALSEIAALLTAGV